MNDEPTFDPRRRAAIRDLVVENAAAHPGRAGGRKRTALVVTLVVLAVSISGGTVAYALGAGLLDPTSVATPVPTVTPTPTPTRTPTPTPTPSSVPAAPAEDPNDPSTWVIDFNGIGPVDLGSSIATVASGLPDWTDSTYAICRPRQVDLVAADHLGLTSLSPSASPDRISELLLSYNFAIYGDSAPATPRTAAGIGIGATLEELMAAYPGITKTGEYADVASYYGLTNGQGTWIVFDVLHDRVDNIQVGPHSTIPSELCPA